MRNIYRISHRRDAQARAATVVAAISVLAFAILATHSRPASDIATLSQVGAVASARAASPSTVSTSTAPASASAVPSGPTDGGATPYFPSQYQLNAGPPEDHVEAF